MLYAVTAASPRTEPTPGSTGICPACGGPVLARCGQINVWHWAHQASTDCDAWAERTTDWHRAYQRVVPASQCEVTFGPHRADLVAEDGFVLELQHSSISTDDIAARERHYGRMVWLFDARDAHANARLTLRRGTNDLYATFRWKQPRRSVLACRKRVLLDLGEGMVLSMRRAHTGPPFAGWGHLYETASVWRWLRTGEKPEPLTYSQYRCRSLAAAILRYLDYLTADPDPGLSPDEAMRIIRAALFPGAEPSSHVRAALAALHLLNRCPDGLLHYASGVEVFPGTWIGPCAVACPCLCGAEHVHELAEPTATTYLTRTCKAGWNTRTYLMEVPPLTEAA